MSLIESLRPAPSIAGSGLLLAASLSLAACSSAGPADSTSNGGAPTGSGGSGVAGVVATTSGGDSSTAGSASTPLGGSGGSGGGAPNGGSSPSGGSSASGGSSPSGGDASQGGSGGVPPRPVCNPGIPSSLSDLKDLTGDDTTSQKTPLGSRYDGVADHVATPDELSFLHDASKQPVIPGSTSGLSLKKLSVTLYPSNGGVPVPADINQHAIGNCDGDTAFASIAYANPGFIKGLITDNHDDTFTVAMYDPQGNRVQVSLDNQFLVDGGGNIGAVSGKNGVADWATVLEKATMKYIQVWPVVADIGGIGSEHQTPMFTRSGGSFAFSRGALSPTDLTRVVKAALAEGKLISGGFGIEGLALSNGLQTVTAHGYAVLVPKDAQTMVSMRNPWGVDPTAQGYDGSTDGVLDIPPDKQWSDTIDLRIIDPGDACGSGVTSPYLPRQLDMIEAPQTMQLPRTR